MPNPLKICVDSNEASYHREIVNYLQLSGCQVEVKKLPICDFIVSDRCGVERKNARDFVDSLKDGRLFVQARDIAASYDKPVIIFWWALYYNGPVHFLNLPVSKNSIHAFESF